MRLRTPVPPLIVRSSLASITASPLAVPSALRYAVSPSEIVFVVPSTRFIEVFSAFVTRIAGALLPVMLTPLAKTR